MSMLARILAPMLQRGLGGRSKVATFILFQALNPRQPDRRFPGSPGLAATMSDSEEYAGKKAPD